MRAVATLLCFAFVLWLFWVDRRHPYRPSKALWIPVAWMFLAGSRWVSSWLDLGVPLASATDYAEGSPIDRTAFLSLIVAAAAVLGRRNLDWARILRDNAWIVLYFAYALSSILWTEEPFVLAKRWIKDLGNPIMALVILSEPRPYQALGVVLRRLAYLLLPLSLLFVRYYPDLGRVYLANGSPMYTGVGHQKNDLGLMCLITGIYLAWLVLQRQWSVLSGSRIRVGSAVLTPHPIGIVILIAILAWLQYMSNSQTALACLMVAVGILLLARLSPFRRRPSDIIPIVVIGGLAALGANALFDIKSSVLALLGRDPTLTNRTALWDLVLSMQGNPFIGYGFMSFWTGERLEIVWAKVVAGVNQAHSGYIEQYLNLGYIGVAFIFAIVIATFFKIYRHLDRDPTNALLRLCYLVAALLYNYTEASFYGVNNIWLLLLLVCMSTSTLRQARQPRHVAAPAPVSTTRVRQR